MLRSFLLGKFFYRGRVAWAALRSARTKRGLELANRVILALGIPKRSRRGRDGPRQRARGAGWAFAKPLGLWYAFSYSRRGASSVCALDQIRTYDLKKNTLCAIAIASMCLVGSLDAQRGRNTDHGSFGNRPKGGGGNGNTAPELDAKSAGAGLVLLAGGALILVGRRRKALA